ncbi:MAG: secretin and TonB N-terminal domain-containing protein [Bacteroidales bacterium]|jgi:hypothetical protein|nr:secretin and TonB N-terminal domain-containing protein [Bacteroidales bacterium]
MRLTVLISSLSLSMFAATSYSQTAKFNLQVETVTIKSALKMIEKQSEFRFFYNSDLADLDKKVTLSIRNKNIDEVLTSLFAGTSVGYRVLENHFVVLSSVEMLQKNTVSGIVTDANGDPLPGVTIQIKGTMTGVAMLHVSQYDVTF